MYKVPDACLPPIGAVARRLDEAGRPNLDSWPPLPAPNPRRRARPSYSYNRSKRLSQREQLERNLKLAKQHHGNTVLEVRGVAFEATGAENSVVPWLQVGSEGSPEAGPLMPSDFVN